MMKAQRSKSAHFGIIEIGGGGGGVVRMSIYFVEDFSLRTAAPSPQKELGRTDVANLLPEKFLHKCKLKLVIELNSYGS